MSNTNQTNEKFEIDTIKLNRMMMRILRIERNNILTNTLSDTQMIDLIRQIIIEEAKVLLKSIEFNDFRPFKGKQRINFECSDDKNVIVILGNNTHGKSTIILSFLWCFYGESKFERPLDILNQTVEEHMKPGDRKTASVKVELEHEGIDYIISRYQSFAMTYNGTLSPNESVMKMTYTDENGETKPCGSTKRII